MEIKIRKSTKLDSESIREVSYKTWIETYPNKEFGITKDDIEDFFLKIKKNRKIKKKTNLTDKSLTYVATINNVVVGYVVGYIRENFSQLQAIYILSKHQNKGVGKMLFDKINEDFFEKGKNVIVQVANYNINAIESYKKWGFSDTGKRFQDEKFRFKSGSIITQVELVMKKW